MREAATGNALSLTVDSRVGGTVWERVWRGGQSRLELDSPVCKYGELRDLLPQLGIQKLKSFQLEGRELSLTRGCVPRSAWGLRPRPCYRLTLRAHHAARVVTGTRKYDHITPVLRALHCMTSCSSADNFQAGDEGVQVHTRSRTVIPG